MIGDHRIAGRDRNSITAGGGPTDLSEKKGWKPDPLDEGKFSVHDARLNDWVTGKTTPRQEKKVNRILGGE
jgi:hypothetical protein